VVLEGDVCAFVVGLPLSADGEDSTWTVAVRAFAARLGKHFSMEVHFSDEYYTSQQIAEERLKLSRRKEKPHSRRRSGEDDSRTAVLILQDFFNDRSQPLGRSLI
jgi:putative transcription antitermination factor YqgF